MIAFEVRKNGRRVCIAGANDLCVLTTCVTAVGKLGKKTVKARPDVTESLMHFSVGGLTSRPDPKKDVHLRWKSISPLKTGDVIEVRILETEKVDRPSSRSKVKKRRPSR